MNSTLFWKISLTIYFLSFIKLQAAVVESIVQTKPINFGVLTSDGGVVAGNIDTNCVITNNVFNIKSESCSNGQFAIERRSTYEDTDFGARVIIFPITASNKLIITDLTTSNANCVSQYNPLRYECSSSASKAGTKFPTTTIDIKANLTINSAIKDISNNDLSYSIYACSCCSESPSLDNIYFDGETCTDAKKIGDTDAWFGSANYGCPTSYQDLRCKKVINSYAEIDSLLPISISQVDELSFGSIMVSNLAGTINQDGTTTGGVVSVPKYSLPKQGSFAISGEPFKQYKFSVPNEITLSDQNNNSMQAKLFVGEGNSQQSSTKQFNAEGKSAEKINGILYINANQKTGIYKGTYYIGCDYQ